MSVCIYLFHDRIIAWTPQTLYSKPVNVGKTRWYIINTAPPIPLNDMILRENVSYNFQKGFFTLEDEELPPDWDERHNIIKKIQILGRFGTIANTQKSSYTDNSIGQSLSDILLMDEIREYRRTGKLDDCAIIQSLMEADEDGYTPDAFVNKLWLQYESYRSVIVYLNRLEFKVRQHLRNAEFDKADELLSREIEKMRT